MAKPKSAPKKAPAPANPPPADTPARVGSHEAYDRFLPAAEALDAGAVIPCRADAALAYHNVDRGLDEVMPHIDRIKEELPKVRTQELAEAAEIALAVIFAGSQIDRSADGSTQSLLADARASRALLLPSADALAAAGLFSARAVKKIHEGNGMIDAAQDCVDLAALFTQHAQAIKGKTAVTRAQVEKAATVGTELLKRLKGKRTKGKKDGGVTSAVERRDRLWTLLVQRHRELRRVGMWLFLDEVDERVPLLQSRAAPAKKREKKGGEAKADEKKAEPEAGAKKADEKKAEPKPPAEKKAEPKADEKKTGEG